MTKPRFWFPDEQSYDHSIYLFFLQDGRRISGQVDRVDWMYAGSPAVIHIREGAATKCTSIPWHAIVTFQKLVDNE